MFIIRGSLLFPASFALLAISPDRATVSLKAAIAVPLPKLPLIPQPQSATYAREITMANLFRLA